MFVIGRASGTEPVNETAPAAVRLNGRREIKTGDGPPTTRSPSPLGADRLSGTANSVPCWAIVARVRRLRKRKFYRKNEFAVYLGYGT